MSAESGSLLGQVCAMARAPYYSGLWIAQREILKASLCHKYVVNLQAQYKLSSLATFRILIFSSIRLEHRRFSKLTSIPLKFLDMFVTVWTGSVSGQPRWLRQVWRGGERLMRFCWFYNLWRCRCLDVLIFSSVVLRFIVGWCTWWYCCWVVVGLFRQCAAHCLLRFVTSVAVSVHCLDRYCSLFHLFYGSRTGLLAFVRRKSQCRPGWYSLILFNCTVLTFQLLVVIFPPLSLRHFSS